MSAAPYPADTRAKGWRFELDYEKIEQSDTWSLAADLPMAQHSLLMMWLVSWRQEPCGSFPNDEAIIRAKCRIPPKTWATTREVLMRGWWLAEDGLLYHPTITKRVLEMVGYRIAEAARRAAYRERMRSSQGGPAVVTCDTGAKDGTGTGTGTKIKKKNPPKPPKGGDAKFELFWLAYPSKVGKIAAKKTFEKLDPDDALIGQMLAALKEQTASDRWTKDGGQFIPNPATWLNQGRWQDEKPAVAKTNGHRTTAYERDVAAKTARIAEMTGGIASAKSHTTTEVFDAAAQLLG